MKTIWIVEGTCGEYSDRSEWPVAWCESEAEANALRDACAAEDAGVTSNRYTWPHSDSVIDRQYKSDYDTTTYRVYSLEKWEPK